MSETIESRKKLSFGSDNSPTCIVSIRLGHWATHSSPFHHPGNSEMHVHMEYIHSLKETIRRYMYIQGRIIGIEYIQSNYLDKN